MIGLQYARDKYYRSSHSFCRYDMEIVRRLHVLSFNITNQLEQEVSPHCRNVRSLDHHYSLLCKEKENIREHAP